MAKNVETAVAHDERHRDHAEQPRHRLVPLAPPPGSLCRADLTGTDRLVGEEPPQVLAHRLGRLVPRPRVLLDRLEHDRLEIARDPQIDRPRLLRLLGLDLLDQGQPVRGRETRAEREQLVEREPQRIDIGPSIPFTPEPLGGHVPDRTQDVTAGGQPLVVPLGQAEIRDPDHTFGVQQQVRRLDVPVHDSARVGIREAPGDLPADVSHAPVERAPTRLYG